MMFAECALVESYFGDDVDKEDDDYNFGGHRDVLIHS